MLRQLSTLTKCTRIKTSLNNSLFARNLYQFSSRNDPPKGFEKFKRKPHNVEESGKQGEDKNTTFESKDAKQEIHQKEQKKERDDNNNHKRYNDSDDEEKAGDKQPQKKKYTFTYDPNLFGLDKPKSDSKSEQNKQDQDEKKQNDKDDNNQHHSKNKSDPFGNMKLNPNNPKHRRFAQLAGFAGLGLIIIQLSNDWQSTISFSEFVRDYLDQDIVKNIVIQRDEKSSTITAIIHTGDFSTVKINLGNIDHFLEQLEKAQQDRGLTEDQFIPIEFKTGTDNNSAIDRYFKVFYLGLAVFVGFLLIKSLRTTMEQMKGGPDALMGKSPIKQFGFEQQVKVKFKDVAGLDEAKNEIKEFVDFLKKPKKYKDIGAKIPRGALLSGPPGTGKTMVAKACAGEAGVPFFYVSGSDFVEMFVGVGASRVRDLFKQAKSKSPSIVFIDEIDAVGRKRESRGNDERDNTLNQLLVEMDGFGTDHNVIVLAATNRLELLDPALTRPGRFDRTIDITLPDIAGRVQIFLVHLQPLKLDASRGIEEYAKRLATLTPGFSGAEISNLCNEAAILAARKNKAFVDADDFEMAAERVMAGLQKKSMISEEERKVVAYHESGHAVVSWFLAGGHPLLKLTIIPRSKGSLGYAQYLPNESNLETREELLDRICCVLGGRCSEQHFFNRVTTGAYDDLKKAYQTAHSIVTKFGMSDVIGYIGYQESQYSKPYSDAYNKKIDEEIKKIIDECTQRVKQLIKDHHQDVFNLSQALLEKESLDLHKIIEILGERPFPPKSNYRVYLELKKIEQFEKDQEKQEKESATQSLDQENDHKQETISQ